MQIDQIDFTYSLIIYIFRSSAKQRCITTDSLTLVSCISSTCHRIRILFLLIVVNYMNIIYYYCLYIKKYDCMKSWFFGGYYWEATLNARTHSHYRNTVEKELSILRLFHIFNNTFICTLPPNPTRTGRNIVAPPPTSQLQPWWERNNVEGVLGGLLWTGIV